MKLFTNFLKILGTGLLCSMVPFGPYGLIFGFPSVFLCSLAVTLIFRKELA